MATTAQIVTLQRALNRFTSVTKFSPLVVDGVEKTVDEEAVYIVGNWNIDRLKKAGGTLLTPASAAAFSQAYSDLWMDQNSTRDLFRKSAEDGSITKLANDLNLPVVSDPKIMTGGVVGGTTWRPGGGDDGGGGGGVPTWALIGGAVLVGWWLLK